MSTIYNTKKFKVGSTVWSCTVAKGDSNYVSVRKETGNPFKSLGTQFDNFSAAVNHYKNPTIKIALLEIELNS